MPSSDPTTTDLHTAHPQLVINQLKKMSYLLKTEMTFEGMFRLLAGAGGCGERPLSQDPSGRW